MQWTDTKAIFLKMIKIFRVGPLPAKRFYQPRVGPPPLPIEQQKEIDTLIKEHERQQMENELTVEPKAQKDTFDNAKNIETGEIDGPKGPEPTRYGDWERKGRVYDF